MGPPVKLRSVIISNATKRVVIVAGCQGAPKLLEPRSSATVASCEDADGTIEYQLTDPQTKDYEEVYFSAEALRDAKLIDGTPKVDLLTATKRQLPGPSAYPQYETHVLDKLRKAQ